MALAADAWAKYIRAQYLRRPKDARALVHTLYRAWTVARLEQALRDRFACALSSRLIQPTNLALAILTQLVVTYPGAIDKKFHFVLAPVDGDRTRAWTAACAAVLKGGAQPG